MNFKQTVLTKSYTIADLQRFFELQRIDYADCDNMWKETRCIQENNSVVAE